MGVDMGWMVVILVYLVWFGLVVILVLSGLPSDATCGWRTPPPEGRDQPNVIPSLDKIHCNVPVV